MDTSIPTWAILLDSLYRSEQAQVRQNLDPEPDCLVNKDDLTRQEDDLAMRINKFSDNQINQTIRFLENNDLVKQDKNQKDYPVYTLTKEGFSVTHKRHILQEQQSREQNRVRNQIQVNQAIGYLTVGLLIATVLNPIIQYIARPEYLSQRGLSILLTVLILFNFVVVVIIISKLWDSGLLTSDLEERNLKRY